MICDIEGFGSENFSILYRIRSVQCKGDRCEKDYGVDAYVLFDFM